MNKTIWTFSWGSRYKRTIDRTQINTSQTNYDQNIKECKHEKNKNTKIQKYKSQADVR